MNEKPPLTLPTILKLKARGNGYRELSNLFGLTVQAIQQRVKRGLPDLDCRCSQCLRKHEK
jgi:hypothetical protein